MLGFVLLGSVTAVCAWSVCRLWESQTGSSWFSEAQSPRRGGSKGGWRRSISNQSSVFNEPACNSVRGQLAELQAELYIVYAHIKTAFLSIPAHGCPPPPLHATKIQLFSLSTICCQHRIQINFSPSQVNITQWAQSVKTIRYENVFNYLQRLGGTPPPPPPCMSWHPVFWCFGCWQLPVLSCWVNRHRSGSTGRDIRQSWSSQTCDFKLRVTSLTDLLPLCHRASLCCSVKITRFFACVHISCE